MQIDSKRFSVLAGFAVLAALLIVNGFVTKHRLDVQRANEEAAARSRQVLLAMEEGESILKDAETGQRGFLLTGDSKYLAPYNRARAEVGPLIDNLANLTADNPTQQNNVAELRNLTRSKLDELAQTVALYRSGNAAAANAMVRSDEGLILMDQIRVVFSRMRDEETRLEGVRTAAYQRSVHTTVLSLILATLAALLGLVGLGWVIVRENSLREKHARELTARETWFRTTLTSIGDAVIATDQYGAVTFLNPVAEKLTGIQHSDATGRSISQVFPIFSEVTGEPAVDPVQKVIDLGVVVGLANHTVLKGADGALIPIDDSAAPIRNDLGELIGVVLVFRDVSERRRAEQASGLLASIVQSSDDAILSNDLNGIVTSWNAGAERIFGYSATEMEGKPLSTLAPPGRKSEMAEILERIRRGEHVDHFHSLRRTKAGKLIHVSLSVSPVRDNAGEVIGAAKIVRDITAQVEAQRAIAIERERLQVTLRSIGDAVISTDTEGRISFLNPVAEQLTGWSSHDATGRPLEEVMHIVNEDTRERVENPVLKVLREGKIVGMANHTVLIARGGKEFPIEDSAAPIRDERGELLGVVLVFRDVTVERRLQEVLHRSDKLAAAARLSATVAHEINNPLAAVVNLIFLARSTAGAPPALTERLEQAEQELERVAHITRQTLAFYRGTGPYEPVEIAPLVDSVLRLFSNKLAAKNIKVQRTFDNCGPVEGAPGELRQALAHLIANAVDAVDQNGTIVIAARPVPSGTEPKVEIVVTDDGPGIAQEHRDRLFEPFFTTKKDVGTGLGLWATKAIIERHRGTVALANHQTLEARGAAFTIQLPCVQSGDHGNGGTQSS